MKKIILCILLPGMTLVMGWGQKVDTKMEAIEKHYQYLENEVKNTRETIQKENEAYRKFIQEERTEHQSFLETTIKWGGGLLVFVGALLTFWGWNTFAGINKSRKDLESLATKELLEYGRALNEMQIKLGEARQKVGELESQYQQYINYYRNADPKNGRYLFIGTKEKLEQLSKEELLRFVKVFGTTEQLDVTEWGQGNLYPASYDVIVYRANVNTDGIDHTLERLVEDLKPYPHIPLVVYATRGEWLKGGTEKKFYELELAHLANNPITLIDNVASAYRVAKMLPKTNKTV